MVPCVAIVDPYSSGRLLAEAFLKRGTKCISMRSSQQTPPVFRKQYEALCFDDEFTNNGAIEVAIQQCHGHGVTHVIAGCESVVALADLLSERLHVPTNGTSLSDARRSKYLMARAVAAQGLRAAEVFQSQNVEALETWAAARNVWPVVVKPVSSVASDNVYRCNHVNEIHSAASTIIGSTNVLGAVNDFALAQEYLSGIEYVVDTVSLDGHHKVTAFWIYERSEGGESAIGYDAMTLLPYEGRIQRELANYALRVLDAVGIRFGPAHCEIMWNDGSPVLIEIGARLSAGMNAVLSGTCGGISQIDETVKAILEPQVFHDFERDSRNLRKRASNVFLRRNAPGRLRRIHHRDRLENLPTVYRLSIGVSPGEQLPPVAGMVTLLDEDPGAIERDKREIWRLRDMGMFETEGMAY
jgi:biotin carboxylase